MISQNKLETQFQIRKQFDLIFFKQMQQSPQLIKYMINTPTSQQVFFSTTQDNKFSSQQLINTHQQIKNQANNLKVNIQPFIVKDRPGQVSQILSNQSPNESNLSKDPRIVSKIDERMRNKYINNIMANTVNYNRLNVQKNTANINQKPRNEDRNYHTFEYNAQIQKKILDFADPLGYQDQIFGKQVKNNSKIEPQSKILIQKTLLKPKFGFKSTDNCPNQDHTTISQNDLISFDTSSFTDNGDGISLQRSKSASNFSDVLRIEEEKIRMRMIKNGNIQGYLINKVDRKQEKIAKKLFQIKKNNEIYDKKIKQKEKEIEIARNKIQKQQKQLQNYQSKMMKAYDNVVQDTPSLLLNSRNYQQSNPIMDKRVLGKARINCPFEGITKKLCKQILYGKCMLLQTQLLQIGFDNKNKPGLIELYFKIKENLIEMEVFLQDVNQNGYTLDQDFQMRINNIPSGKKIKAKINVNYLGSIKQKLGFIKLRIIMKINASSVFQQNVTLPFLPYRNFFSQIPVGNEKMIKANKQQPDIINKNYKIVTQWQNSCEQLIKNPKNYLDSIFNMKTGRWIQQNVYHITLKNQDSQYKSINILINNRSFAIQITDTKNIDIVTCVGSLLARAKDSKDSKISRFI